RPRAGPRDRPPFRPLRRRHRRDRGRGVSPGAAGGFAFRTGSGRPGYRGRMFRRLLPAAVAAALLAGAPALAAAPQPTQKIDINAMLGRWYEVARFPNPMQKGCMGGTSDWTRNGDG